MLNWIFPRISGIAAVMGIAATGLIAASPAAAFDGTISNNFSTLPTGGPCNYRVLLVSSGASVSFVDFANYDYRYAEGSIFDFVNGNIYTGPAITAAYLENTCDFGNVTNLQADGAQGTLATDDAMFVTFTGNTASGRYAYNIGMYGVTGTTETVSAILVDTPPTVALSGMSGAVQGRQTITVTFNEDVTGLALSDLTLVNATVSDLATVSASSYSFYLRPTAAGAVSVSLGAGKAQDSVELGNIASNTLSATATVADPIVASFSAAPEVGTITPHTAFFTDTSTPTTGETITSWAWDFGDSGTSNAQNPAHDDVSSGTYDVVLEACDSSGACDTTGPTTITVDPSLTAMSATLSGISSTMLGPQTVTITFSSEVDLARLAGFTTSDFASTNLDLTNLALVSSGASLSDPQVWSMTATPITTGPISLGLRAAVVENYATTPNSASNTLTASANSAEELVAEFMYNRANALLSNQPGLRHLLDGSGAPRVNVEITRDNGDFDLATGANGPFWMTVTGAWSDNDGSESLYVLGTIGAHSKISDNLLIGGMLELDFARDTDGAAITEGKGWLAGPYVVAKLANQPLYFEGRLLYGQSSNTVSPIGTFEDSFTTERWLAAARVTGDIVRKNLTLSPFADLSYTSDTQAEYVDSFSNTVASQSIALGQVKGGLDFQLALEPETGETMLTGGISGIWLFEEGTGAAALVTPAYVGGRARVALGFERLTAGSTTIAFTGFYDGIGTENYESYGLEFGVTGAF